MKRTFTSTSNEQDEKLEKSCYIPHHIVVELKKNITIDEKSQIQNIEKNASRIIIRGARSPSVERETRKRTS